MPTSVGPDGIDVSGYGWTNQSSTFNSSKSLESYGSAASSILNASLREGYSAWSYDPIFSPAAGVSTNGVTFVVQVYVPQTFTCKNVDWIQVTGTNSVTVGLWSSTAPAGTATPLAWTLATGTAATATAVNTLAWSTGASSPTSVVLTGGQSYLVTLAGSAATGTIASLASTSYTANASTLSWSTTTTYRAATLGTQLLSITSASTFGTSTLSADLVWVGLH
jgi:hypothetical protein